jgi:pectate lyase
MNKTLLKITSKLLVCFLIVTMFAGGDAYTANAATGISISNGGGWFESAYVEWSPVSNAVGYNVYVKSASAADSAYVQLDNELIRQYSEYWRADAVGLSAGDYVMKVESKLTNGTTISSVSDTITVEANDRSGFAFSDASTYKTGSGAYNEDGTLKSNAKVIYITSETAATVTLDVITSSSGKIQTGVGIGQILTLRQKGYDTTPLAIRFIGQVTDSDMNEQLNSSGYLQVKGKSSYKEMNMTLEGIGEDATAYGWGILIRNSGNLEIRNMAMMLFPDDGISLDTDNCNIWVHNNDILYGAAGSDADQVKGDGSADVKGASTYVTLSYNHFWDSGKCSLCGMKDTTEFFVTYHHNWFDHSDSRQPRIRVASVHVYNNYFDGISKYGVGTTKGSSAFVEANYFRHCKYPLMSSLQGTDALGEGTFSDEEGGMIKAFNNKIENASSIIYANSDTGTTKANAKSFDAYLALTRNESVPSSYKTIAGSTTYNNFDINNDLGVSQSDIDDKNNVEEIVTNSAGRLNQGDFTWEFTDSVDDTSSDVNTALMSKITSYTTGLVSVGGN